MPLRNAAKQQPWGAGFDGASFCNFRIGADDARRVLCDVVLPSGRLEGASVYVDEDEKAFRCSVGWVIREGEKANPLAELQKAALPLDRAIDAAVDAYEELDKTVLQPTAEFLDNTVLSLDATQAALGVALADADKGVANAKAELDKALAAAEASYESLAAGPKALAADAEKAVANSALIKFTPSTRRLPNSPHWLIAHRSPKLRTSSIRPPPSFRRPPTRPMLSCKPSSTRRMRRSRHFSRIRRRCCSPELFLK